MRAKNIVIFIVFLATASSSAFAQWSCVDAAGASYKALQRIWADTCTNDASGEIRQPNQFPPLPTPKKSSPAEVKKITELGRAEVLRRLKDPDSAKFRGLFVFNGVTLCGEVNSKNSMGGYVGFQRFLNIVPAGLVELDSGSEDFENSWMIACKGYSKSLIEELRFGRNIK